MYTGTLYSSMRYLRGPYVYAIILCGTKDLMEEYEELREEHYAGQEERHYLTFEKSQSKRKAIDFEKRPPAPPPLEPGVTVVTGKYELDDVLDYIDWNPFFQARSIIVCQRRSSFVFLFFLLISLSLSHSIFLSFSVSLYISLFLSFFFTLNFFSPSLFFSIFLSLSLYFFPFFSIFLYFTPGCGCWGRFSCST